MQRWRLQGNDGAYVGSDRLPQFLHEGARPERELCQNWAVAKAPEYESSTCEALRFRDTKNALTASKRGPILKPENGSILGPQNLLWCGLLIGKLIADPKSDRFSDTESIRFFCSRIDPHFCSPGPSFRCRVGPYLGSLIEVRPGCAEFIVSVRNLCHRFGTRFLFSFAP